MRMTIATSPPLVLLAALAAVIPVMGATPALADQRCVYGTGSAGPSYPMMNPKRLAMARASAAARQQGPSDPTGAARKWCVYRPGQDHRHAKLMPKGRPCRTETQVPCPLHGLRRVSTHRPRQGLPATPLLLDRRAPLPAVQLNQKQHSIPKSWRKNRPPGESHETLLFRHYEYAKETGRQDRRCGNSKLVRDGNCHGGFRAGYWTTGPMRANRVSRHWHGIRDFPQCQDPKSMPARKKGLAPCGRSQPDLRLFRPIDCPERQYELVQVRLVPGHRNAMPAP